MPGNEPTLYPCLSYRDAPAAMDWLIEAFGFEKKVVYEGEDGTIEHAELGYGPSRIMFGSDRGPDDRYGPHVGQAWIYMVVDDPDAHYERAKAAGAEIVEELHDQDYGSRDYSARDPEGNLWNFGTYQPATAGHDTEHTDSRERSSG